jgi:hypothetical protein
LTKIVRIRGRRGYWIGGDCCIRRRAGTTKAGGGGETTGRPKLKKKKNRKGWAGEMSGRMENMVMRMSILQ